MAITRKNRGAAKAKADFSSASHPHYRYWKRGYDDAKSSESDKYSGSSRSEAAAKKVVASRYATAKSAVGTAYRAGWKQAWALIGRARKSDSSSDIAWRFNKGKKASKVEYSSPDSPFYRYWYAGYEDAKDAESSGYAARTEAQAKKAAKHKAYAASKTEVGAAYRAGWKVAWAAIARARKSDSSTDGAWRFNRGMKKNKGKPSPRAGSHMRVYYGKVGTKWIAIMPGLASGPAFEKSSETAVKTFIRNYMKEWKTPLKPLFIHDEAVARRVKIIHMIDRRLNPKKRKPIRRPRKISLRSKR